MVFEEEEEGEKKRNGVCSFEEEERVVLGVDNVAEDMKKDVVDAIVEFWDKVLGMEMRRRVLR